MRLSLKMVLIFSAMMLAAFFVLSSLAANSVIEGAGAFTEARFRNMATGITRELQDDFTMMKLTLDELAGNTTFMAALNQMVRDDTDDQKMGIAAGKAALAQMDHSPLVRMNDRVSFYTRDGIFLTSPTLLDDGQYGSPGTTNRAGEIISSFAWLDRVDSGEGPFVLALHEDFLSEGPGAQIYGVIQRVSYKGKELGYLEIDRNAEDLAGIMAFVDDESILVQVYLSNGQMLFSSTEESFGWPDDMEQDTFTRLTPDGRSGAYDIYHTFLEPYSLHMVIAQPSAVIDMNQQILRGVMFRRALMITVPAILIIIWVSFRLTRSTRRLTRKVRGLSGGNPLSVSPEETRALTETVTSPVDRETFELEQVLNEMIRNEKKSASTELALREGTLQAQLNALQTQINPHFIYNTLNIISAKSMESGNYDVIEICDQFAQMLRYSTDTRSRTATMAEEIENVRSYLALAKARYEDNLEYRIDVPEDLNGIIVPKLTLQPLVENALTHGFDGMNVLRKLAVSGRIENDTLILEIRDNGSGFSDEMLRSLRARIRDIEDGKVSIEESGGHIGLVNTCLRLHYYSNGAMRIAIRNDEGAVVTLTMPCGQKNNPA